MRITLRFSDYRTERCDHRPSVISPPIGCQIEFSFIQHSLPTEEFQSSETEGLNLNVTVPKDAQAGDKLPVFVFLHGGGYFIGGNTWPQYDLAKFVNLSTVQGKPIIAVNIKYIIS